MDKILENIQKNNGKKTEQEVKMMGPLVLAYVGDAVFEIFIRNYLVMKDGLNVNQYHKKATRYVRAKGQSEIVHALENELTEEEWTAVKRGRNQKSATVPKNANISDYRYATGFEALLGYLFYMGNHERLQLLMNRSVEIINNLDEEK